MTLRPSHRLVAAFLAIAAGLLLLLVWLGLRLYEQDRALEVQRIRERRESAADLVVARLQQDLLRTEESLGREAPQGDALLVTIDPPAADNQPAAIFQQAETLEFHEGDFTAALAAYRELARSRDAAVRAGAQFRLARMLRRRGEMQDALDAYAQAASAQQGSLEGVPISLLARWARCDLLAELERAPELRADAEKLERDLRGGHWALDRRLYEFHTAEVSRWLAHPTPDAALAAGIEWIRTVRPAAGRYSVESNGRLITILWPGAARRTALVAGPDYAQAHWLSGLTGVARGHSVRLGDAAAGASQTLRLAANTGLPWNVQLTALNPAADLDHFAGRRNLFFAALAIVALLFAGGSYLMARAILHDLAVARLQSDFVSAVSHEFRTPLTSLREFTDILIERNIADEDRRRTYYHAMARQTHRLQRLVEDLLDFGRMERGNVNYRMESLPAANTIRAIVDEFRQQVTPGGWQIDFAEDDPHSTVRADREALTRAVWNLLDNAVKYSKDCRTVWTEVANAGDRVAIRVRDRGMGLPAAEQKQVFRKFVRGSAAKAENIKGTGIGLAIVQQIVHAHRGELQLQSELGVGSTFTILLPKEAENGTHLSGGR